MTTSRRALAFITSFGASLLLALPAYADTTAIKSFVDQFIDLINKTLVPLVFAIAFIVFIWGVFQYFIAGGANEEKRKEGAQFVMWGIIGFAVMLSVWGLVHILSSTFDTGADSKTNPALPTFTTH